MEIEDLKVTISESSLVNKIKSNETMYRHIPSIMPVESAYLGSQYGYRTDPID